MDNDKNELLEELWKNEKQLILLLENYDQSKVIKNGSKKLGIDGFSMERISNKAEQTPKSRIFLPASFGQDAYSIPSNFEAPPTSGRFMGGSLSAQIDFAEKAARSVDNKNKEKKFLTFEENSVELEQLKAIFDNTDSINNRNAVPSTVEKPNANNELEKQIHELSTSIIEQRKRLELDKWSCDKIGARELNVKMGGKGSYINEDNEIIVMPDTPLSETCPHRTNVGDYPVVLRCVTCPANYDSSKERLYNWLDFVKARQEQNKKKESK